MTIVAGFRSKWGTLLCSDMEEGDFGVKKQVRKLLHLEGQGWQADIGGSGSAPVLDLAFKKLEKEFRSHPSSAELLVGHEESIRSVLFQVHEKYVWPSNARDYGIEFLISLNFSDSKQSLLYRTHEYVPQPIDQFVCIGAGAMLGNYLASHLYHSAKSRTQFMYMAFFLVHEVRDFVSDCGQGTQIEITMNDGRHFSIHPLVAETDAMNEMPSADSFAQWFWDSLSPGEYSDNQLKGLETLDDADERFTEFWKDPEPGRRQALEHFKQLTSEKSEPKP